MELIMTKKIFRGIFLSSLITMLACLIFIIGVQYRIYDESRRESLERKAYLISLSADEDEIEKYDGAEERVTLIDASGKVLYDNKYDAGKIENHAGREEVREALSAGSGYAVRRSETLGVNTCYYALRLEDGSVLRVADTSLSVSAVILELLVPICGIAVLIFVLGLVLASLMSKKILRPINNINLEEPGETNVYDELAPFVSKIEAQQRKINSQIAELTRSRREFDIIAENMSEGLVLTDLEGHILTHNTSVERFFGVSGDINGKNILNLNRSEVFREIYENIKESRRSDSIITLNGKYYEITANPVFDENGKPCGTVILVVDITEREKREKLRRDFTANVSHELKTPLTSILGISDMLKNGMVDQSDIKGFAEDINKETARLITLVNDIIRLSELVEGKTRDTEKVDLLGAAKDVAERISPVARKQGITLSVEGESAEVTAGESLIFEMIYNLCDNAIKYNKENGSVKITAGVSDGSPFISVKDTGIGIPPEEQEHIFERFYRVDKGRSKESGGTGLGLSIVKHIAVSFGGRITVNSEPGAGTEITVIFPEKRVN